MKGPRPRRLLRPERRYGLQCKQQRAGRKRREALVTPDERGGQERCGKAHAGSVPDSRATESKALLEHSIVRNECIVSGAERPKSQFRPREERMFSHASRTILAASAAVALFASVHSVQAAEFAGSVEGVVKSASGQALSGAYVKLINPERRLTFM